MDVEEETKTTFESKIYFCDNCKLFDKNTIAMLECTICDKFLCQKCDNSIHKKITEHLRTPPGMNKTNYNENDYIEFRKSYYDWRLLCMRRKKCETLYELLGQRGIVLLKSPPGSGKTFMANLFKYYIQRVLKQEILYTEVNGEPAKFFLMIKHYLKTLFPDKDLEFEDLKHIENVNFTIIVDEAQKFYEDEKKCFWDVVKTVAEYNKNRVKVLCFAAYADTRAETSRMSTPFCFTKVNTLSLPFMRFDRNEFDEYITYYEKHYPESEKFQVTAEIKEVILNATCGHPELTEATLTFLQTRLKGMPSKNVDEVKKQLWSIEYMACVESSKSLPKKQNFSKLSKYHEEMLKIIFLQNGIEILDTKSYDYTIAKELEFYGFLYENIEKNYFYFVSDYLAFSVFSGVLKAQNMTIPEPKKLGIVNVAIEAIKTFHQEDFLNAFKLKEQTSLCENQWHCEFYRGLKNKLFSLKSHILCQATHRPFDSEFKGFLDLYVNTDLKWAYELLIDGNDPLGHILRKFKAENPDYFKNVTLNTGGLYKFPLGTEYLVIEFTNKNFYTLKDYIIEDDGLTKLDLKKFELEKYIMRVKYSLDFANAEVTYMKKKEIIHFQ